MLRGIQKFNKELPRFGIMKDTFTEEEIGQITFLERVLNFEVGSIGDDVRAEINMEYRNSKVGWIPEDDNTDWIYHRIAALAGQANADLFFYNADALSNLQFTVYSPGEHYDWHVDSFAGYVSKQRKISGTLMLSDPSDYEGGDFQIVKYGNVQNPEEFKAQKGDLIWFDSSMPHRVTPVTSGVRKSLVFWISGDWG